MRWKDRSQSENITDIRNDPIGKAIAEELSFLLMGNGLPRRRYVPWVEGQIEAIQNYQPPTPVTSQRVHHSPGGYIRNVGSGSNTPKQMRRFNGE